MVADMVTWGDPDEVSEHLSAILAHGIDGLTCNLPANGHQPDNVELLGLVGSKLVG
jgi:hypothetical protein